MFISSFISPFNFFYSLLILSIKLFFGGDFCLFSVFLLIVFYLNSPFFFYFVLNVIVICISQHLIDYYCNIFSESSISLTNFFVTLKNSPPINSDINLFFFLKKNRNILNSINFKFIVNLSFIVSFFGFFFSLFQIQMEIKLIFVRNYTQIWFCDFWFRRVDFIFVSGFYRFNWFGFDIEGLKKRIFQFWNFIYFFSCFCEMGKDADGEIDMD